MLRFFKKYWPLFLIIILSVALRLYKLSDLFYYTYDEAVPSFVGRRLILWHHLPLIGGVTPFGVHITPYFYWSLAALLFIGKLNPITWGVAGALFAGVTTCAIYYVGSTFQNKKLGFTASVFWAFSYLANLYDRHFWALYWGPLLSLIVIFCLFKLIKKRENYVFPLALALAWGLSTDPSNIVFVVLTVIVFISFHIRLSKKTLIAAAVFLFSFAPLVFFDLRHDFANTRPFLKYLHSGKNSPGLHLSKFIGNTVIFPRAFTRLIYTFGDNEVSKQYSYCMNYVAEKYNAVPSILIWLSAMGILGFFLWSFKRQNRESWGLLSSLLILYFVGIQIYGTIFNADIFEHYVTGLFAVFLLIMAKAVSLLPKKMWLVVLALFIAANLFKLSKAQNGLGLAVKKQAIDFTMQSVGQNDFSLESLSTCWKWNGYRYLFAAFGREPVKSYVDPNFGYLYGTTPIAQNHPKTVVAFVAHDFSPETGTFFLKYNLYKSNEIKSAMFGNLEVIVMDNSSAWFDKVN